MTRSILTFETVFQVLAADNILKGKINCRTVPTPAGLSSSICGISIEILEPERQNEALQFLADGKLVPQGIHQI